MEEKHGWSLSKKTKKVKRKKALGKPDNLNTYEKTSKDMHKQYKREKISYFGIVS